MERLRAMTAYCKTTTCYRAQLLKYFGENAPQNCGCCGNCTSETVQTDITVEAQKILSGVARVEKKYAKGLGLVLVLRMLNGSRDQRVLRLDLDKLPTYGIMSNVDRARLRAYADALLDMGYMKLTEGEYPVVRLDSSAWPVLRGEEKVWFTERVTRQPAPAPASTASRKGKPVPAAAPDDGLYDALRALRLEQAKKEGVPAYIVFTNAALADMALKRPRTMDEFLKVSGVGTFKASQYGETFLEAIRAWEEEHKG